MTAIQKQEAKQTSRKLYQTGRISLEMAIWAMKNTGYAREEAAEWLELNEPKLQEAI
jgi:hypothetical protein